MKSSTATVQANHYYWLILLPSLQRHSPKPRQKINMRLPIGQPGRQTGKAAVSKVSRVGTLAIFVKSGSVFFPQEKSWSRISMIQNIGTKVLNQILGGFSTRSLGHVLTKKWCFATQNGRAKSPAAWLPAASRMGSLASSSKVSNWDLTSASSTNCSSHGFLQLLEKKIGSAEIFQLWK